MAPARATRQLGYPPLPRSAQVLDIGPGLGDLVSERGLRRGGVFGCEGLLGTTSFLLGLLAGALSGESWAGVIGLPGLGIEAASNFGVPLKRLVLVPDPGRSWLEATAVLLDACDLVVLCPSASHSSVAIRQLATRARARRAVLLIANSSVAAARSAAAQWSQVCEGRFIVSATSWQGLAEGSGTLTSRVAEVGFIGRGAAVMQRRLRYMLPTKEGHCTRLVETEDVATVPPRLRIDLGA